MLKRIAITLTLLTMIFTTCVSATTVEFFLDDTDYSAITNYQKVNKSLLAAPFIQNDRTMIPVRAVSESFGCEVSWDGATRSVTITKGEKIVSLTIDKSLAYIDGAETTLDAPPCIINDTTFVPVRFVTEALGYSVNFVPKTRSVLICDQPDIFKINGQTVSYPELEALCFLVAGATPIDQSLGAYAETYLMQNTVLYDAAIKNSIKLSDEQSELLDKAIEEVYKSLPISKGAFAQFAEREELANTYLNSVVKDEDVLKKYVENFLCAKHILISEETDSKSLKLANEVYNKAIRKNADFDTLVKEYGTDPGMSNNPNGYVFTDGEMVKEFEDATKALKEGGISKPVKSSYGYHIIKRMPLPELDDNTANKIIFNMYVLPLLNQ